MRDRGHLLRILGVAFGLAAVVGSVIGQGILRSPGVVAEATGSAPLIIALWIGGALISCLFAFSFAELGAAIPRAGGLYAFVNRAFGGHVSVLAAFAILISFYASLAYMGYVVGEFLVRLGVGEGRIGPGTIGLGVIVLFALLNASGTRSSGTSQILFSALKGVILLGLIIALFGSPGAAQPTQVETVRNGWLPLGTAVVVIITTFAGWWNVAFFGEEIVDPARAVPRALFGGILGVAALYVLINIAMLHVMTPDQMAGSNLVAADAAGVVFGPRGDFVLTCFGVLSVGAIGSLNLMTGTRFTYAIARAGVLPRTLAVVGKHGTPIRAMLLNCVAAGIFILTDSYLALVTLGETVFIPVLIACHVAVIALRRSEPDLVRPYRVPFYPWTSYAAILVQTVLLVVFVVQDPFYAFAGFILVGALWLLFELVARLRGRDGLAGSDLEEVQ